MAIESTRLRFVSSKKPENLVNFLNRLPFMVEIKGAPVKSGLKWYLWFVLPEVEGIDFTSGDV